MSLAKVNEEIVSTYNKHITYLDDRIIRAKAMIVACDIMKDYLQKRNTYQSVTKIHCQSWSETSRTIHDKKVYKFEEYLIEELGVFGYKAEIRKPGDASDELKLTINEELP